MDEEVEQARLGKMSIRRGRTTSSSVEAGVSPATAAVLSAETAAGKEERQQLPPPI